MSTFEDGTLHIDFDRREVTRSGRCIKLLDYEYGVLAELASQQGKVLSYDQLFEAGWGRSDDQASKRVMYAVRRIGLKLGWRKDDWQHFPIEAVPGSGYRYRSQS